jgi:hypothetical protein
MTASKKRSIFDAVQALESQDAVATKRKKQTSLSQQEQTQAAQSQTEVFASLMECRILVQRAQAHLLSHNTVHVNEDDTTESEAVEKCDELIIHLLETRQSMHQKNDNATGYQDIVSTDQLAKVLQSEYEQYRMQWKDTLNRSHESVRLHAGLTAKAQFRVIDDSFWQQVENTVQHDILRSTTDDFEDTKVYQQMLKDFLAASVSPTERLPQHTRGKSSTSHNNNANSNVDRKASKGRKLRYHEISKLINFTFPLSRPESGGLDEDEWFRSLFGGTSTPLNR